MTFIGPRPDTPVGSAAYTEEEKIILTVRPGVTGYNQAVNRNSVLTKEKLKNNLNFGRTFPLVEKAVLKTYPACAAHCCCISFMVSGSTPCSLRN